MAAILAALGTPAGNVSAGDMEVRWWFEPDVVVVSMDAPTHGWVAVGFNHRPALDNARLVMAAVRPGGHVAEEHHARPPSHPHQRDLSVRAAEEADGRTRIVVEVPRAPAVEGTIDLAPGAACGLTVAWSHDDDFAHHSAWRGLVQVDL